MPGIAWHPNTKEFLATWAAAALLRAGGSAGAERQAELWTGSTPAERALMRSRDMRMRLLLSLPDRR